MELDNVTTKWGDEKEANERCVNCADCGVRVLKARAFGCPECLKSEPSPIPAPSSSNPARIKTDTAGAGGSSTDYAISGARKVCSHCALLSHKHHNVQELKYFASRELVAETLVARVRVQGVAVRLRLEIDSVNW